MPTSFITPEEGDSEPRSNQDGSRSPEAPPYSPITPPLKAQQLPSLDEKSPPTFMEKPPEPVNLDMESSTDAMALRAALSALQVQRLRAVDHMKLLQVQKANALSNPERFVRGIADGSIKAGEQPVTGIAAALAAHDGEETVEYDDEDEEESTSADDDTPMSGTDHDPKDWKVGQEFGTIPAPQNVVRMPPINWSKYKVVGEPLDALHQEQLRRPDPGQAQRELSGRPKEHIVAAPYSPWRDKLPESSMRTRSDAKRP